jgi:hypothetical protein
MGNIITEGNISSFELLERSCACAVPHKLAVSSGVNINQKEPNAARAEFQRVLRIVDVQVFVLPSTKQSIQNAQQFNCKTLFSLLDARGEQSQF